MTTPISCYWKEGSRVRTEPWKALAEFDRLRERHGVGISAEALERDARRKRSPFHTEFEWDDAIAGLAHRRARAGLLLRSFVVVYDDAPEIETRAFEVVCVTKETIDGKTTEKVYASTREAMQDREQREQILARALKELESFKSRYANLSEFAQVCTAIDNLAA